MCSVLFCSTLDLNSEQMFCRSSRSGSRVENDIWDIPMILLISLRGLVWFPFWVDRDHLIRDSFVVIHFRPITIVVKLYSFRVAFILVNFSRLAVETIGRESFVMLAIMFYEIVKRCCCELRFARVTKIHNFKPVRKFQTEARRDCVWLCDIIWNVVRWPGTICDAIVEVILMVVMVHGFWQNSLNRIISIFANFVTFIDSLLIQALKYS